MRKTKQGISLIVLAITILVMVILAGTVIVSLNNSGIIGKSKDTVKKTNIQEVQRLANLAWVEVSIDIENGEEIEDIEKAVKDILKKNGIKTEEYNITADEKGVTVEMKETITTTLGSLITNPKEDYGKLVNYTVTVDGEIYSKWQIYYHNEEYVYLILDGKLPTDVSLNKGTTVASLTAGETNYLELYEKFRVGDAAKYTLADTVNGNTSCNSQAVAQLIIDYANFGDTTESYKEYVVGAIGGPTLELLAAGWNAKVGTPTMTLTIDTYGYKINTINSVAVTSDGLYVPSDYYYWLASPSVSSNNYVVGAGYGGVCGNYYSTAYGIRPVVCLKSSIPATVGTGDYAFSLTE